MSSARIAAPGGEKVAVCATFSPIERGAAARMVSRNIWEGMR